MRFAIALFSLVFIAGCVIHSGTSGNLQSLEKIAHKDWVLRSATGVSPPVVLGYASPRQAAGSVVVIFIEGDGLAWRRRNQPSADPTPKNPMGFKLAVSTPAEFEVAYVARPCQFAGGGDAGCEVSLWTSHRYGPENVAAVGAAVDQLKRNEEQQIVLVGYSGGGVIAALLAAVRKDVAGIVTVGANLDTQYWTSLHGVTPLYGSQNPADLADQLKHVPQVHFTGSEDSIVPTEVLNSYLAAVGLPVSDHLVEIRDYDHHCCWEDSWPQQFGLATAMLGIPSIEQ